MKTYLEQKMKYMLLTLFDGNKIGYLGAIVVCSLYFHCSNPFFPPTGLPPIEGEKLRSTPEGVIEQLVTSYQEKRLSSFRDLLISREGFRFYVESNAINQLQLNNLREVANNEKIEGGIPFIDSGTNFGYITYDTEIKIHRQLFAAQSITFITPLRIDSIHYIIESETVPDSDTSFTTTYDTTAAVVRVWEKAQIEIYSEWLKDRQSDKRESFKFTIEKQVFYLVRDPEDPSLWVIAKWFELYS